MADEFLSPYGTLKVLEGVIPANKTVRPNWLQTFFGRTSTRETKTVNFDTEFTTQNVMGANVAPDADVEPIQLGEFGHKELAFSYAKEGLASPDFSEIDQRQLGQPLGGKINVAANEIANIRQKLVISEQRFENLFELNASNIIYTGGHVAESISHPKVVYNFGRTKVTTATEFNKGYVPEVDLTTINVGGVGNRAWSAGGGTPVKDLITMVNTANRRAGVKAVVMSEDAYELFEADISANYKDAATLTLSVENRIQLKVLPTVEKYQGLNYKRSYPVGNGAAVDIFTYTAVYHTRAGGVETSYVPNGYVACLPNPELGLVVYGRIMHPRANWKAMKRWINHWEHNKTGKREWEVHMNYLMGHTDINSLVCWKVK